MAVKVKSGDSTVGKHNLCKPTTQINANYRFQKQIHNCGGTFQRNKNYDTTGNNEIRKLSFGMALCLPAVISLQNLLTNENDLHNQGLF